MADAYYDYNNGLAGNTGLTVDSPKATRSQAVAVAGIGGTCIALDGTHTHETGHFVFDDNLNDSSHTYRGATLQPNNAESTRCARTSASLPASGNPFVYKDLVFLGRSPDLSAVTQALEIGQDAAEDITTRFENCEAKGYGAYCLLISNRRGRFEMVNGKLSGDPSSRFLGTTSSLAGDGNQAIDIQGLNIAPDGELSTMTVIGITKVDNLTNTFDVAIKGVTGTISVAASAAVSLLDLQGCAEPSVSGWNITINADDSVSTVTGLLCRGRATAITSNAKMTNNVINYNSPAGFALLLGQSIVASNVTGGEVSGNKVTGKYYASATPHNIIIGQGVTGTIKGNASINGYVGYLISKTTNGTVTNNTAYDCYGPSYYVKGTTACTVKDNVAVLSGGLTQRDRGVLAVAPQGATNTAGATIQENLVIVQDVSKIHSLAYIEDASQVCSFVRNTYIIPDTVDISTANLFSYENGIGGAANNTLAQWNAQTEVTDDVIVQMPASEIGRLVNEYKAQVKPKPDLMYINGQGVRNMVKDFVL